MNEQNNQCMHALMRDELTMECVREGIGELGNEGKREGGNAVNRERGIEGRREGINE